MRLELIGACTFALFVSAAGHASSNVDGCSPWLAGQWRDAISAHPIDPSKHIPVVMINVPLKGPPSQYQDAIRELSQAFPSFKEGPGSGILLGCCAFPVIGSISFDDLAKLTATDFVALCDIGYRSQSNGVQVRIEYREQYEGGVGAAPYFWISSVQIVKNQ